MTQAHESARGAAWQLPGSGSLVAGLSFGPADGRPVIALHGWLDNAASFSRLAPLLADCRVVAVDMPGHGLSAHRAPESAYHFIDWVADVARVADGLGWRRFHLLGHSMGAGIASLVAATFPDRVVNLTLVEGLAPLCQPESEAPAALARHLKARAELINKRNPIYKSEDEALAARMGAGQFATPDGIRLVVRRGLVEVEGGVTWRSDSRLRLPSALRLSFEQVAAFMDAITVPTKIVLAKHGLRIPELPVEPLAARLARHGRLTRVALDGFHHLHLDDPAPVAAEVAPFIASGEA